MDVNLFDQVKSLPLSGIISQYTDLNDLGGGEHRGSCPIHGGSNQNAFTVNDNNNLWYCFSGCGGGSVIEFVTKMNLAPDGYQAAVLVAESHGIEVSHVDTTPPTREELLQAVELFCGTAAFTSEAADYCASRGLDADMMQKWGVGLVPDSAAVLSTFRDKGMKLSALMKLGYATESFGEMRIKAQKRLLFPIIDGSTPVGYSARLVPDVTPGKQDAKYVNSPASTVYDKSQVVFGSQNLSEDTTTVVILEGQLDAMIVHEHCYTQDAGITAVAVLGSVLTHGQWDRIRELAPNVENVILFFDNDEGGRKALCKASWLLSDTTVLIPDQQLDALGSDTKVDPADMAADGADLHLVATTTSPVDKALIKLAITSDDPQQWFAEYAPLFPDAVFRDRFIRTVSAHGVHLTDTVQYGQRKAMRADNPYVLSLSAEMLRLPPVLRNIVYRPLRSVFQDVFSIMDKEMIMVDSMVAQSGTVMSDADLSAFAAEQVWSTSGTIAPQIASYLLSTNDVGPLSAIPAVAAMDPSLSLNNEQCATIWCYLAAHGDVMESGEAEQESVEHDAIQDDTAGCHPDLSGGGPQDNTMDHTDSHDCDDVVTPKKKRKKKLSL